MSAIREIKGRQILDSRGNPTIEAEVMLESGARGRAAVPSGASTGEKEAIELRDGDKKRWMGKGVSKAVANISRLIAPELLGKDAFDQIGFLRRMLVLRFGADNQRIRQSCHFQIFFVEAWYRDVEMKRSVLLN